MTINTHQVLARTMPVAIPGVNYLSGGQSLADACARLSAINRIYTSKGMYDLARTQYQQFLCSSKMHTPLIYHDISDTRSTLRYCVYRQILPLEHQF